MRAMAQMIADAIDLDKLLPSSACRLCGCAASSGQRPFPVVVDLKALLVSISPSTLCNAAMFSR